MEPFTIGQQKANTFVDQFLIHFRDMYGPQLDPMSIPNFGDFKLDNMGNIRIYDLKLTGISHMKREGSIEVHTNGRMKLWTIKTNLSIANITADFKVDAQLHKGLYISGWALQVLIDRCLLTAVLDYDESTKMMTVSKLGVNSIEGFTLNTDNLSWPFNDVVPQIIDHQMDHLKTVIGSHTHKYLTQTLKSFNVSKLLDR
ncbi:unnamed protein product, partial [Oppiella nova]